MQLIFTNLNNKLQVIVIKTQIFLNNGNYNYLPSSLTEFSIVNTTRNHKPLFIKNLPNKIKNIVFAMTFIKKINFKIKKLDTLIIIDNKFNDSLYFNYIEDENKKKKYINKTKNNVYIDKLITDDYDDSLSLLNGIKVKNAHVYLKKYNEDDEKDKNFGFLKNTKNLTLCLTDKNISSFKLFENIKNIKITSNLHVTNTSVIQNEYINKAITIVNSKTGANLLVIITFIDILYFGYLITKNKESYFATLVLIFGIINKFYSIIEITFEKIYYFAQEKYKDKTIYDMNIIKSKKEIHEIMNNLSYFEKMLGFTLVTKCNYFVGKIVNKYRKYVNYTNNIYCFLFIMLLVIYKRCIIAMLFAIIEVGFVINFNKQYEPNKIFKLTNISKNIESITGYKENNQLQELAKKLKVTFYNNMF